MSNTKIQLTPLVLWLIISLILSPSVSGIVEYTNIAVKEGDKFDFEVEEVFSIGEFENQTSYPIANNMSLGSGDEFSVEICSIPIGLNDVQTSFYVTLCFSHLENTVIQNQSIGFFGSYVSPVDWEGVRGDLEIEADEFEKLTRVYSDLFISLDIFETDEEFGFITQYYQNGQQEGNDIEYYEDSNIEFQNNTSIIIYERSTGVLLYQNSFVYREELKEGVTVTLIDQITISRRGYSPPDLAKYKLNAEDPTISNAIVFNFPWFFTTFALLATFYTLLRKS